MPHLEYCITLPANFLYCPEQTQIIGHSVWISAWYREGSPLLQNLVSAEAGGGNHLMFCEKIRIRREECAVAFL